jgi:adenylate kinase
MKLVFLGPPGAGKGTIAALAKEQLKIPHISTGELFRNAVKNGTPLGKKVKDLLAAGELVSDADTVAILCERLKEKDAQNGFILDGFPRTINQADELKKLTKIDYVINFDLGREEILKRLSGRRVSKSSGKIYHILYNPPKVEGLDDETGEPLIQREDDKEEAILHRLEVYAEQTEPLIDYYTKLNLLKSIDAKGEPKEILKKLLVTINF